jgi:tripartite-type tricarboxylate transporter receptor subunit TctC
MRIIPLLISAVLLAVSDPALVQTWPAKPVRFLVAQGPGSNTDTVTRWVADKLTQNLGRAFMVENVQGGGGLIAAQNTLRAGPDGYSYFVAGGGMIAIDRYMYKSLPYDSDRDFTPVALLFDNGAFVIAAHPDVPAKNLPELIALAKAQPGKLSYGSDSVGVTPIIGQWFNIRAGTEMVGVPYKSAAQLVQDFLAGRTQLIFTGLGVMQAHIKSGKARALAVTSDTRFPTYPEVSTVAETLPGFKVGGIGMLVAPTSTPVEIVQRLNHEVDTVVRDPKYAQFLLSFGWTNSGARTLPGLLEFMREERERWNEIFKVVKFEPQ